jgi:hypothetical protein
MVVILNTWFTENKSSCNGLSFCMLLSSIVIEINILLIDQIVDNFVRHPVFCVIYFIFKKRLSGENNKFNFGFVHTGSYSWTIFTTFKFADNFQCGHPIGNLMEITYFALRVNIRTDMSSRLWIHLIPFILKNAHIIIHCVAARSGVNSSRGLISYQSA